MFENDPQIIIGLVILFSKDYVLNEKLLENNFTQNRLLEFDMKF